jgi:ribosomal protein L3 glutamine methyltransferase
VAERVPVAYLVGRAWFAGLPFRVDPRVLVPRSPFAELVAERFAPWVSASRVRRIADIGTGSGCIAIACAHAFPEAEVDAAEIDPGAREVAAANAAEHGVGDRVRVVDSDVYAGLDGRYDLIVSNPPYVARRRLGELPPEFAHEPSLGLDGGEDGLDVVRRIIDGAAERLEPGGALVVEVGESQAAVEAAYPGLGFLWVDLARGGEGIFVLTSGQLAGGPAFLP